MGYSSKWPKALRYGTHKYSSLKLQYFGLEQLIQKIDTIHRFTNNKDFKHLLTNMIDSFQLTSGDSTPVLENKKWKINYVNSTCTTSLVQELQQYNIQQKLQTTFKLTKQIINDSNVMENELTNNNKLTTTVKKFNACRLFLQVNYLSEITTIDGKSLDDTIIGTNITKRSESTLLWPNQMQPKSEHWKKWIKKIKQRYCIPNLLQLKEQFIRGKWNQPNHKLTHNYKWIFYPRLMEAYHNHKTYSCNEIDHLSFSISHESNNQNYKPPSDSHLVHVQQNKFTINVNSQLKIPNKPQPTSFTDYYNHLQV